MAASAGCANGWLATAATAVAATARERLAVGGREVAVQRQREVADRHAGAQVQRELRPVVLGGHRHAQLAHARARLGDPAALVAGDERDDLDVDAGRRQRRVEAGDPLLAAAARRVDGEARRDQEPRRSCRRRELLDHAVPRHRAARSRAAAPMRRASRRLDHSGSIAAASASACGSTTSPSDAVGDELGGAARVVQVITGLPASIASSVTSPKSSSCGMKATARAPA